MQSNFKVSVQRQGIPFFMYLVLSSGLLFNHESGADMAFLFLMIIILLVPLSVAIFIVRRKKWGNKDLILFLAIGFIYLTTSNLYLAMLWDITSWLKK